MDEDYQGNKARHIGRRSLRSPDKRTSSGFKYPRRLCTQKIDKYVDIYGRRPTLSPVRTRSQSHEDENFQHEELPSSSPLPLDKMEDVAASESPLTQKSLISASTPKRLSRSSGRYGNIASEDGSFCSPDENLSRSRSRLGSPSSSFSCDNSRLSISSDNFRRRRHRHPEYDPTIEIRQAKERHLKYRSGKWADTSDLYDAVMEDKERYKEKLLKKAREKGQLDERGNPTIQMEEDDDVLARRQRDIDNGKTTPEYESYVKAIPKPVRKSNQPRTPNKFIKYSRRQWDGLVRQWRRHLHTWETEPNPGAVDSFSSVSSFYESISPFSERDSVLSSRGKKHDSKSSTVRRSRTPFSNLENAASKPSSATAATAIAATTATTDEVTAPPVFDDEDTMMGFPQLGEPSASLPTTRRKRFSGNSNSNSAPHAPDLEALSTGLTSDVNDALNVRGTPTKRKNMDDTSETDRADGGTPRKRARQQCSSGSDEQSFAQVVKMNVFRGGGSPYKLRSQIRKAPTIQEESSVTDHSDSNVTSYAQAARGPARKLIFNEGD